MRRTYPEPEMLTTIVGLPRLTDAELEELGRLNEGWSFERDDDGRTIMAPMHTAGGARNAEALAQLIEWRQRTNAGGMIFDSDTGFKMSTDALRCPDGSWISQERIDALSDEERQGFWKICPDVVIEVRSVSDQWQRIVDKVEMYRREGARYAVAIDPFKKRVVELGEPPPKLRLDFDAIMKA